MAFKNLHSFLSGAKFLRRHSNTIRSRSVFCHFNAEEESSSPEAQEETFPPEWYEMAFSKMKKWRHSLKELDLIGGRLVNTNDHSRVLDDQLEKKMHTFKSIARVFIGLPSMQKNLVSSLRGSQFKELRCFCKPDEREALTVTSLTKVSDILSISAQQRKVVRKKIGPQVTQHKIWTGVLVETLNGLKTEIEVLIHHHSSKEVRLAQQIVAGCLNFLESSMSYEHEATSWMRLTPTKGAGPSNSPKWGEALEMWIDLENCLSYETELSFHVQKLKAMKEGLYQIRDVLVDKNIGYKENRFQEHLVQKKLMIALGHSSQCLFTLLLYYLYGNVGDVEVEVRGGFHAEGSKSCLYMGKILTVDEEKVVWNGVKQLDRAMGLFKFVWESAGMKGDLQLQGHLWCVGAQNRSFVYRGNVYFVHEIDL